MKIEIALMRYADGSLRRCLVNNATMGGEYTACGNATPDSSLEYEGVVCEGSTYEGRIDCGDCISQIKFFKSIPAARMSKKRIT